MRQQRSFKIELDTIACDAKHSSSLIIHLTNLIEFIKLNPHVVNECEIGRTACSNPAFDLQRVR